MVNKINQKQKVLKWLRTRGDLTVRDAVLVLGINCVTKRIEELRKEGYVISTRWEHTANGSRYGVYTLEEDIA